MEKVNTTRSDKIVKEFLTRDTHCKRKVQIFEKKIERCSKRGIQAALPVSRS